jgi:hypothetical protein
VSETFQEQYAPILKDVFSQHARQQLQQGVDGLAAARAYAEQGKPDFTLAFLLSIDLREEEKRALLAQAYDQRARNSDEKAAQFQMQFHRSFPLIKLEAQRDRAAARAIREGRRIAGMEDEAERKDDDPGFQR